jgi:hypothetical protein
MGLSSYRRFVYTLVTWLDQEHHLATPRGKKRMCYFPLVANDHPVPISSSIPQLPDHQHRPSPKSSGP